MTARELRFVISNPRISVHTAHTKIAYIFKGEKKMKTIAILIYVGLFVSNSKAFEFSNPTRSVSASNNKSSSDSKSTTNFGSFSESARIDWEENWETVEGPYLGQYYSVGSQYSTITSSGITAYGSISAGGSFDFWGYESLHQNSSSSFQVDFEIDLPREVTLTGELGLSADTTGTNWVSYGVFVTLSDQTGEIFSHSQNMYEYLPEQINKTFFLDTGIYTFSARAVADEAFSRYNDGPGQGGGGMAYYDIVLTPEPTSAVLIGAGFFFARLRRRQG
jgi:hypothetical protein